MLIRIDEKDIIDDKDIIDEKDISGYINNCNVVLIYCHAKWSGRSQSLMTILEEISEKYKDNDNLRIVALDIGTKSQIARLYNIEAIPHLLCFKKGELWDSLPSYHKIRKFFDTLESLF